MREEGWVTGNLGVGSLVSDLEVGEKEAKQIVDVGGYKLLTSSEKISCQEIVGGGFEILLAR